jgi:hypothetical protein
MTLPHDRIVFSLEHQEQQKSALDEERDKHKTRCVCWCCLWQHDQCVLLPVTAAAIGECKIEALCTLFCQ